MPILAVHPEALAAAGGAVVATGDGLGATMAVLTAGFGANTGLDVAGMVFGLSYQSTAESLLKLATAAVNACRCNGAAIQASASNYSRAEAASRLGGGGGALSAPSEPARIGSPGPPGTLGPGEPPPLLWALVQSFVDDVWPDGDVPALHAAAGCWRAFGSAASGMQGALNASKTIVGTQQIPEADLIGEALSQMGCAIDGLGDLCGKMAAALHDFANQVAHAQSTIRDLLRRLESLTDLWHDVISIFNGDGLEEIKRIAEDINAVLHNLGREARALEQGAGLLMQRADNSIVDMEKHMRGKFTHFLGDEVGNPAATVFDTWVNGNEAVVKAAVGALRSMVDLDPRLFLLDPKGAEATWMDMTKTGLLNDLLNPQEAGEANLQSFKSLLHLEDWRRDRPGLGLGGDIFEAVMLSGGGETGAAVDGARAGEAGAAGAMRRAGELGDVARASGALRDIGKVSDGLTKDLENLKLQPPKSDPLPGGRPVGVPPGKPIEAPVEPTSRPVESAPPGTRPPDSPTAQHQAGAPGRPSDTLAPHEPPAAPAGVVHDRASLPAPSAELASTNPRLAGPARVHAPAGGSLTDLAPDGGRTAEPALTAAAPNGSSPHFAAPGGGQPLEMPSSGGRSWHEPGDGGPSGGGIGTSPHGGGPHDLPGGRPCPHPPGDDPGSIPGDDGAEDVHGQSIPTKVRGVDYPLPAADALRVLEHPGAEVDRLAGGGIPRNILDGYEPLARRTVEQFEREFTVQGSGGERWWDWDVQAPKNGFVGEPLEGAHIPIDLRLDRVGPNGGGYLSPEGTPLPERATPPGLAGQYHVFEGTGGGIPAGKDWVVQHGPAKEAFGQPGGGEQWVVIDRAPGIPGRAVSVEELIEARMLKEIRPHK
jgi:hypothetical protein